MGGLAAGPGQAAAGQGAEAVSEARDPWHEPFAVLVLDTLTGCTGWERGVSPFGWIEGNWSCDCNRGIPLGIEQGRERCMSRRFLVIACDWPEATFDEMNSGYPPALVEEFLPYWEANRAHKEPAGADEGRGGQEPRSGGSDAQGDKQPAAVAWRRAPAAAPPGRPI